MLWTVCQPLEVVTQNQMSQTRTRAVSPAPLGTVWKDGCSVYLVHVKRILLGKNHVHGVSQLLKLEIAGVLAVLLIAGIFSCFLGLLHV